MDKYETIEVVGEGSYGIVMKCRHKETKQTVAIKKFLETEEDPHVRKMAFREIRMLKKLRHDNLVNLIEVFRRRKRFYLVFEYLDHTVLDELESAGGGLGFEVSKRHVFQILRGLNFCHTNHIMHRDIKPENILVSPNGVIKLCDFGFARFFTGPNESCTDYVATRWYRAPELLVGDTHYGKAIDIWAVGCLYAEMVTGDPLFPGESDIDQLYKIIKVLGSLCSKHQTMVGRTNTRMLRRTSIEDTSVSPAGSYRNLRIIFPTWNATTLDFLSHCLRMDPDLRPGCSSLLQHPLFTQDNFSEKFSAELRYFIEKESVTNPLILKRDESRRMSVFSTDETPPRICQSGIGRWQTNTIKDAKPDKFESKGDFSLDSFMGNLPSTPGVHRFREFSSYLGPSSMSIKKLESNRTNLFPESGGCMLPALPSKEPNFHFKQTTVKRRRPEIPSFG